MKDIPFFYFDFRARIIPGSLVLAVIGLGCASLDWKIPKPYDQWMTGSEGWKTVAIPLVLVSVAYLIGDAINALLRPLATRFGRILFSLVIKERLVLYPSSLPKFSCWQDEEAYRLDVWEWLLLKSEPKESGALSHAHRFLSEARMFLNASMPAALLVFGTVMAQHYFHPSIVEYVFAGVAGIATFMAFLYCGYLCEKRRWTQTLSAARQLSFSWKGRE